MATTRECAVCPATTNLKACSRCKEAFYCSTKHAKLLWPIHKRFCATGVEPWFEDDLSDAEIEKIKRLEAEPDLIPKGVLNYTLKEITCDLVPPKMKPECLWDSLSSKDWAGDPLLRSWLISLGRHAYFAASLGGGPNPSGVVNSMENLWLMLSGVCLTTYHPYWIGAPNSLELRTKFLHQITTARYFETKAMGAVGLDQDMWSYTFLGVTRLEKIAADADKPEHGAFGRGMVEFAIGHRAAIQQDWEETNRALACTIC